MSICSMHRVPDPECRMCNVRVREGGQKHEEALAAGLTTCTECSFEYYMTTDACPKCEHTRRALED